MMIRRKIASGSLLLLLTATLLVACENRTPPRNLTGDRIEADLSGRTVTVDAAGSFQVGRESYAEIREQRQEGSRTVVRAALRAIDAKAGTGIEGELELTYHGDGRLAAVAARNLKPMGEPYAKRLAELTAFPLHFAANIGDRDRVEEELQKGNAVDLPEEKKGSTAVMFAAERGFAEIVERLVAKGADINLRNKYGFTALHAAASNNHAAVVKFLLEKGAQVDPQDELGQTPLYFAAERGHLEPVRLLVAKGADVNKLAKKGWTPLYAATSGNFVEIAKVLLEHGATVNIKTSEGTHSPLLIAACNKNPDMVRLLLNAGADRSARLSSHHAGYKNQTALDIAKRQGDAAIVELLQQPPAR